MQNENSSSQLGNSDKELQDFKMLFEQKLSTAQKELTELKDLFESKKRYLKEQLHQFINWHIELIEHCKNSLIRI